MNYLVLKTWYRAGFIRNVANEGLGQIKLSVLTAKNYCCRDNLNIDYTEYGALFLFI